MNKEKISEALSVNKQCRAYGISLWECPRFLFLIMAGIIIVAIIISYFTAKNYFEEPEITALVVLITATILFILNYIIVAVFERVAESSRAKSEFVSIISHQLRTPLSAIKWQLNLLSDKNVSLRDQDAKTFLANLEEQNERMIRRINDLLELNRVEDKALFFDPSAFSLKEIAAEVINRHRKATSGPSVPITLSGPDNLPLVFADKIKIKSVVDHLLDNAIRYSTGKEGVEISVILEGLPKFVRCSLIDKGIGIPKEDIKRIFNKFFRSSNALKYQTEGLGLRLHLSKAIIEATGGKIGFKTIEGEGSTFWFTLPIADGDKINHKPLT